MTEQWEYLMLQLEAKYPNNRGRFWQVCKIASDGVATGRWKAAPEAINEYGAEGWELVDRASFNEVEDNSATVLIFKRRKQS
jgi:uncharacterized protein DUF4177